LLKRQKLQFAVATIDSFLLNARGYGFPGTIMMVIDESKGGDAVVAYKDKAANLDELKRRRDLRIGFTPASPSEHLLRSLAVHFDIPLLKQKGHWRVETNGSADALRKLQKREVDAAVLWEPDVSTALENRDVVKLLGTEDTEKLIVDILVVERDYSRQNPDAVKALLSNYFRTLKFYRSNSGTLRDDVKRQLKVSGAKIDHMLQGVQWINMYDNVSRWFGVSVSGSQTDEGVIEVLQATSRILVETGAVGTDPIPEGNPYALQNKSFLENVFSQGLAVYIGESSLAGDDGSAMANKTFSPLTPDQWSALKEIGTFRIRPITFQSGTDKLDRAGELQLKEAAQALQHYPNFRILVAGHTGTQGDRAANKKLSDARAKAVGNHLLKTFAIDPNRLFAVGYGSDSPLARQPEESDRAYQYRLPRVELRLVSESF
jgi:outer membrane protein OmpA-like peptidoglycan-associated protein